MLENFPPYNKNYLDAKNIPNDILTELQERRFKKTGGRPKYLSNLLRYAFLLIYTSTQAYKLLLELFPLPSLSLLKKLTQGGVESLKAVKLLLGQGKTYKDVVLLIDEIYLQDEKLIGDEKCLCRLLW